MEHVGFPMREQRVLVTVAASGTASRGQSPAASSGTPLQFGIDFGESDEIDGRQPGPPASLR